MLRDRRGRGRRGRGGRGRRDRRGRGRHGRRTAAVVVAAAAAVVVVAAAVAVLRDRRGRGRRGRLAGNRRRVGVLLVPGRRRRPVRQPSLQLRGELSGVDRRPDGALPVPGALRSLRRHGRRRGAMR